jgi:hypothetical protein
MMRAIPGVAAFTVLVCMSAGGCSSSRSIAGPAISPSLVMPPALSPESGATPLLVAGDEPGAWEYGRNDARLNVSAPPQQSVEWSEIQSRQRTYTTNGRPREFSSTFLRSYSLRRSD